MNSAHDFRLYQLDSQKTKFKEIVDFTGLMSVRQKIEISPAQLLNNRGSFYVRDLTTMRSSYSTGLIDLTSKALESKIDTEKWGIQPSSCIAKPTEKIEISWIISDSVKKSCSKGYTVVVDGPISNVFTLPCTKSSFSNDLSDRGLYKVRVESRENDELGAYFIISSDETSSCLSDIVINASYSWTDDSKLRLQWAENDLMASAKIEIDSYQIFVKDDLGEVVWAKIIERIELVLESEEFLVYQIAGLKEKFTS